MSNASVHFLLRQKTLGMTPHRITESTVYQRKLECKVS